MFSPDEVHEVHKRPSLTAQFTNLQNRRAVPLDGIVGVFDSHALPCSPAYENPDGFAKGLVRPRFDMQKVVRDTVKIFADIPLRNTKEEPNDQPEAVAVIVVDYDGQHPAKLVSEELAPQAGSPIPYHSFVRRICELYSRRFGKGT